jgi:hypothetical protein
MVRIFALSIFVVMTVACQLPVRPVSSEAHAALQAEMSRTYSAASIAHAALPKSDETPKPPPAESLDQLMKALQAAQKSTSFRAQLQSQINDDEADELTLEIVAPNRRRIRGHNLQIIIIGEDGYLSFGDKWQKAPRDPEAKAAVFKVANAPVFWGLAENAEARKFITIKSMAETTLTNTTLKDALATLFEYEMKDAFGKIGLNTLRTWVTKADGLPRKTEMAGEYEGRKSKATLTWVEYNAALTIEPPVLSERTKE